jgi:TRAP transporter 4TM/12TM fusion protein
MERFFRYALTISSFALVSLVILFGYTLWTTQAHYCVLFLLFSLLICILSMARKPIQSRGRSAIIKAVSIVLAALSVTASLYFYLEYVDLLYRVGATSGLDLLFGVLILIPLMVLIWKEGGSILSLVIVVFLLYSKFGYILPGLLFHKGLSVERIVEMVVLNYEGIYGFVNQVVATWVAIFIIYAGLIQGFGTLDVVMKICLRVGKRYKFGLPQIPVVTSMIFGMFSGAAAANVAGTGSFTIPLLKKVGFPPWFAGAIESVASTGGQIMPPIMGATAFLMAALLGMSYSQIMLIGFIPAIMFYVSIGFSVYLLSTKYLAVPSSGTDVMSDEIVITNTEYVKLVPLIISLGILLLSVSYFMIPLMRSALYGIASFLIAESIYELIVSRRTFAHDFARGILTGVKQAAVPAASMGVVGAAMGLIVKTITVTALAPKLSFLMVDLAHGFFPLLVFLVLLVSLLFGCMVATLAVYVLVVFLAAPALAEYGIPPLVTHFIIFYFSAAAMITPPVAPAALVASGIAGTSFMRTGWESMKLGVAFLILPLAFLNYPELLIIGPKTIAAVLLVQLALLLASYAFYVSGRNLWMLAKRTGALLASGIILFCPLKSLNIAVGLVALGVVLFAVHRRRARAPVSRVNSDVG